MITLFDQIQDKPNEAYFTDSEKMEFINRAQIIFISEYTENYYEGGPQTKEKGFVGGRGTDRDWETVK